MCLPGLVFLAACTFFNACALFNCAGTRVSQMQMRSVSTHSASPQGTCLRHYGRLSEMQHSRSPRWPSHVSVKRRRLRGR
jgi:hypothetical protein